MTHLEDITLSDLQTALEEIEDKKPTQRLITAIAYKNGVTQSELADWYDVERKTIYNWLSRLEKGNIAESATDERRSGRERKLSDNQFNALRETLKEPPESAGLDATAWTPKLVQQYLQENFNVEYSIPSCRRLMKESGLRYTKSNREVSGVDTEQQGDVSEAIDSEGVWVSK